MELKSRYTEHRQFWDHHFQFHIFKCWNSMDNTRKTSLESIYYLMWCLIIVTFYPHGGTGPASGHLQCWHWGLGNFDLYPLLTQVWPADNHYLYNKSSNPRAAGSMMQVARIHAAITNEGCWNNFAKMNMVDHFYASGQLQHMLLDKFTKSDGNTSF